MKRHLSRRQFIERSALVTAAAASMPLLSLTQKAKVPAGALLSATKGGSWERLNLTWDRPDNPVDGVPIGNGHLGARVAGGVETEALALNDKWFWSGGPGLIPADPARRVAMEETRKVLAAGDIPKAEETAKGMWGGGGMGTFLPLGMFSVAFDHGNNGTGDSRVLDIDRALATVKYTVGDVMYTRETFASFPDDVIVMRVTSSAKGSISFTAKVSYPPEMDGHAAVATEGGDTLVM
jgi:hypothetical protein